MSFHAAVKIADRGLDDIYSMQDGYVNLRAVLTMIKDLTPAATTINDLANLGILEANEWLDKSADWAETIRVELDSLDQGAPSDDQYETQAPGTSTLNSTNSKVISDLLTNERAHATKLWTCLNELRINNHLPDWLKNQAIGNSIDHDLMLSDRTALNEALFANNAAVSYTQIPLTAFSIDLNSQAEE